ncbi:SGNH/GDSL hydrolase family protein [Nesterenkonia sp. Act20]|uniref:SGNH/GDSL hydrolase family protein n=1 Tax=Nesterenkonia sp. Act20 TaxID=1483432 RepID=UPI001C4828EE|nr:SGNH/GDSL hydrolase family protein [Nesterenkonia sp. Act20]
MEINDVDLIPLLRGALDYESTARGLVPWRLPSWAREQSYDPAVGRVAGEPTGVRLDLRTAATSLVLRTHPTRRVSSDAAAPQAFYDVIVDGALFARLPSPGEDAGTTLRTDRFTGKVTRIKGVDARLRVPDLPAGEHHVQIWLPHNETTELISLFSDAEVDPGPTVSGTHWLHHGSSISHGFDAAHPTGTWPAVAAAAARVELTNLALSGQAMLDPFTARTIRSAEADVISVKLGINIVNEDAMRLRTFVPAVHGFLDTIREGGHAQTPLLLVSPLHCRIQETTPGPLLFEELDSGPRYSPLGDPDDVSQGRLTLQVVRTALRQIANQRMATDPHLHFLDGLELFGAADEADLPLRDQLHPGSEAHLRIGQRFANVALARGGPLNLQ